MSHSIAMDISLVVFVTKNQSVAGPERENKGLHQLLF